MIRFGDSITFSTEHANGGSSSRVIRVLLADDHQPILDRVTGLLSIGYTVVAAVTRGDDAVTAVARLHPDVLILDVSMPGLNGFEAAARVRDAGSTAAIIFLSVHREPEFLSAAWDAGALGYVRKSFLDSDLVPAIRAVLDGRRFVSESIEQGGTR
jgi:DNA-binding NarL/FixJ family response regulator